MIEGLVEPVLLLGEVAALLLKPAETIRLQCRGERQEKEKERDDANKSPHMHAQKEESRSSKRVAMAMHEEGCISLELHKRRRVTGFHGLHVAVIGNRHSLLP